MGEQKTNTWPRYYGSVAALCPDDVLTFACPACGHEASMEARRLADRVRSDLLIEEVDALALHELRRARPGATRHHRCRRAGSALPYSPLPPLRPAGSSSGMFISSSSSTAHGSMSTNRRSGAAGGVASASRAVPRLAARFPALARVGLCAATAVPLCRLPAQRSTAPLRHAGPFLSTAPT